MPDLLSQSSKRFVVVPGDKILLEALRIIQEQDADDEWLLVVQVDDDTYQAARLGALREEVKKHGQAVLSKPLAKLGPPLLRVAEVDQEMPFDEAQTKASQSPGGMAVVTWGGDAVIGVLTPGVETGAFPVLSRSQPTPDTAVSERRSAGDDLSFGDVARDVNIAGDDINITNVTEVDDEYESGPEWLRNAVEWAQGNVVLAVVGFFLFVLLPTGWFLAFEVIPEIAPQSMGSGWGVAVASFTPIGDERVTNREGKRAAEIFYERLSAELTELEGEANLSIEVWGPDQVGRIRGETAAERSESAARRADAINADFMIYGTIERRGGTLRVRPEFFVNSDTFFSGDELFGEHRFGGDIPYPDRVGGESILEEELSQRSKALALITRGLTVYFGYNYESAYQYFQRANEDEYWSGLQGREVIYLFEGNAALRAELFDQAEAAYREAIDIEPEYARAYGGLGSLYGALAIEGASRDGGFFPDVEQLNQSLEILDQAMEASIQPPSAYVPARVAYSRGQAYIALWLAEGDESYREQAIEAYQIVIDTYNDGEAAPLQLLAAEAHGRLGLIEWQQGNFSDAVTQYRVMLDTTGDPARQALAYSSLGQLERAQGNEEQALEYHDLALERYADARIPVDHPDRLAELWARESLEHERYEEYTDAISSLRQAIRLLPEDSEERAEYERRLEVLRDRAN